MARYLGTWALGRMEPTYLLFPPPGPQINSAGGPQVKTQPLAYRSHGVCSLVHENVSAYLDCHPACSSFRRQVATESSARHKATFGAQLTSEHALQSLITPNLLHLLAKVGGALEGKRRRRFAIEPKTAGTPDAAPRAKGYIKPCPRPEATGFIAAEHLLRSEPLYK